MKLTIYGGMNLENEERLKVEYEEFLETERGREWKHFWKTQTGSERAGDFGAFLYDFYPEMLM